MGTHTVTASVTDSGGLPGSDTITVTVNDTSPVVTTLKFQVVAGNDDGEERASGKMYLHRSDLELVDDFRKGVTQIVGIRFAGVTGPQGAVIARAYVQFEVDETGSDPANLMVGAKASDNSAQLSGARFDISSRPTTSAGVPWVPAPWSTNGSAEQTSE